MQNTVFGRNSHTNSGGIRSGDRCWIRKGRICTPGVLVLSIEDMTSFVHMLTELSVIVALAVAMALEVLVPRSYSHSDIGMDVLAGTDGPLLIAIAT